ncbi:MAG TPA: hypothetical protein VHC19_04040 [Pirellulales bacterium]|nr:hypothetical protein [Pirellulales bacterium]
MLSDVGLTGRVALDVDRVHQGGHAVRHGEVDVRTSGDQEAGRTRQMFSLAAWREGQ